MFKLPVVHISIQVVFPFKLDFCDWLFALLPSSRFEADEAGVIRDELPKEIFLGRNEYFYTNFWEKKNSL